LIFAPQTRDGEPVREKALLLLAVIAAFSPANPAASEELLVFAAASLREAFTDIQGAFDKAHPLVRVALNLAGSQELAAQIENGAAADVIACADSATMMRLTDARLVSSPTIFARNAPVVVTGPALAETIREFGDLPRASRIVLGAPEVPIGRYSIEILDRASRRYGADFRKRVEEHVVSKELNVRQVLGKVALGEADAAIVYRTDTSAAKVRVIDIPPDVNVVADYPMAVVSASHRQSLAEDWVTTVLGPAGQAILRARGFLSASGQTAEGAAR
jgi:molybdate transport system substrate-binding protein